MKPLVDIELPELDGPVRGVEVWRLRAQATVVHHVASLATIVLVAVAQLVGTTLFGAMLVHTSNRGLAIAGLATTFAVNIGWGVVVWTRPASRAHRAELAAVRSIFDAPSRQWWVPAMIVALIVGSVGLFWTGLEIEQVMVVMAATTVVGGLLASWRWPGRRRAILAAVVWVTLQHAWMAMMAHYHRYTLMLLGQSAIQLSPTLLLWVARRPLLRPVYEVLPASLRAHVLPFVETSVPEARAFRAQGRDDEAAAHLRARLVLPTAGALADILDEVATLLESRGDLRAMRVSVAALRLCPRDPRAFRHLARWLAAHDPARSKVFAVVADELAARSPASSSDLDVPS